MEPGFTDSPQAAEPRLAVLVVAHKNHVAVAFVPALINPPGLDAVVQNLLVNAPALEIGHHCPVVWGGLGQKQVLGLFLLRRWHKRRRWDGSHAGDGFHGLQKGIAVDLDEIVQRAVTAGPARKPAPFAVGNPQAVMGPGAVDVTGHMDQLLGFAGLQVGEQVHLPCPFDGF